MWANEQRERGQRDAAEHDDGPAATAPRGRAGRPRRRSFDHRHGAQTLAATAFVDWPPRETAQRETPGAVHPGGTRRGAARVPRGAPRPALAARARRDRRARRGGLHRRRAAPRSRRRPAGWRSTRSSSTTAARDRTGEVARARRRPRRAAGAQRAATGVALRVGYQLAREHRRARSSSRSTPTASGTRPSSDGVLEPLVDGEADFVIGSRVLGRDRDRRPLPPGRRARLRARSSALLTGVAGHRHVQRLPRPARRGHRDRPPDAGPVPDLRAADRRDLRRATGSPSGRSSCASAWPARARRATTSSTALRYARVILSTWWRERRAAGAAAP